MLARHGRSFWLASRFLPVSVRRDVSTIYAFFRYLDDLADTDIVDRTSAKALLEQWFLWAKNDFVDAAPEPALGHTIARLYRQYRISASYTAELTQGILADLTPRQIRTRGELYRYCYEVGGTVGLTLAPVLGVRCRTGQAAAAALGIAMQLTNITRDLGEDLRRHRLYVPVEDLCRYGIEPESLYRAAQTFSPPSPQLQAVIRLLIVRARQVYQRARAGYRCLPEPVRFAIIAAAEVYAAILQAIERNRLDTIRLRAVAGYDDKVLALLRAWKTHNDLKHQEARLCPICSTSSANR